MRDADCIAFLQWALPQLGMRWTGFRKVRRQVCKRIARRMKELDLKTVDQYRDRLEIDPDEWPVLDAACRITISRFYRDKHIFDVLGRDVLPVLAAEARQESCAVCIWCAGCASGEETYTLAILWEIAIRPAFSDVDFDILGTDADPVMIARAEQACYSSGTLKDMPENWRSLAFSKSDGEYRVKLAYRKKTRFQLQDIHEELPDHQFNLVLCRNLAFTYFASDLQRSVLNQIKARIRPFGYLVIGAHESLPEGESGFEPLAATPEIYRLQASTTTGS